MPLFLSLKCFTHHLKLPVPIQPFPYAHCSHANIKCGHTILNKKFYLCTLPENNYLTSHSVPLKYDHVTGAGDVIFSLV